MKKRFGTHIGIGGRASLGRILALVAMSALCGAIHAGAVAVHPQQATPCVCTESATNVAFNLGGNVREMTLRFVLPDGCASNCLQVAFGRDADGDGVLDVGETETLYGWRNGRRFAEGMSDGVRIEEFGGDGPRSFSVNLRLPRGGSPGRFSATDDGGSAVLTNLSVSSHAWLCRPGWNMMRVTRRGPGVPVEWLTCDLRHSFFAVTVR